MHLIRILPTSLTEYFKSTSKLSVLKGVKFLYKRQSPLYTTSYCNFHHTQFTLAQDISTLLKTNRTVLPDMLKALDNGCELMPQRYASWIDKTNVQITHYFSSQLSQVSQEELEKELKLLVERRPPSIVSGEVHCHPNFKEQLKRMEQRKQLYGVYRFTCHCTQGHYHIWPAPSSNLLGHCVSLTNHIIRFWKSKAFQQLSHLVSQLFAVIDPGAYLRYRKAFLNVQ